MAWIAFRERIGRANTCATPATLQLHSNNASTVRKIPCYSDEACNWGYIRFSFKGSFCAGLKLIRAQNGEIKNRRASPGFFAVVFPRDGGRAPKFLLPSRESFSAQLITEPIRKPSREGCINLPLVSFVIFEYHVAYDCCFERRRRWREERCRGAPLNTTAERENKITKRKR